jgi:hypothetical protein
MAISVEMEVDKYQRRRETGEDRNMKIRGIEQTIAYMCLSGKKDSGGIIREKR